MTSELDDLNTVMMYVGDVWQPFRTLVGGVDSFRNTSYQNFVIRSQIVFQRDISKSEEFSMRTVHRGLGGMTCHHTYPVYVHIHMST